MYEEANQGVKRVARKVLFQVMRSRKVRSVLSRVRLEYLCARC